MKRDFIDTSSYKKDELINIANLGILLKKNIDKKYTLNLLYHKSFTCVFDLASIKSIMSFTKAINDLGGSINILQPKQAHIGVDELNKDASLVMNTLSDAIILEATNHEIIKSLSNIATIPVINTGTNYNSPVEELSFLITMLESIPEGKKLEDIKVVYVGNDTEVRNSLMMLVTKIGANFALLTPNEFVLTEDLQKLAYENCKESNGTFVSSENYDVLTNADFVITDSWYKNASKDKEEYKDKYSKYIVNKELISYAGNAKVINVLSTRRKNEMSDEVMNSSFTKEYLENYLAASRAILVYLLGKYNEAIDICNRNLGLNK